MSSIYQSFIVLLPVAEGPEQAREVRIAVTLKSLSLSRSKPVVGELLAIQSEAEPNPNGPPIKREILHRPR